MDKLLSVSQPDLKHATLFICNKKFPEMVSKIGNAIHKLTDKNYL